MKRFISIICLLLAGLGFAQPTVDEYGAGYWTKSYYVQAGANVAYTNGDLNERAIPFKDSTGKNGTAYPPDLSWMFAPDIQLGVDIRFFSLGIAFQYTSLDESLTQYESDRTTNVTYWRLGLEFIYNIFWPEDFQIGIGLGYAYSSIKAKESAILYWASQAEYMGLGVGGIVNAHYYFTDHIAIVPAIKVYENWFKNLYTSSSGSVELDPYRWQTIVQISLSAQYKF